MKKKEETQNTRTAKGPEKKKGVKIAKTILNVVINVMIVIVLIFSVLVATLALTSKSNDGVSNIFGYSFHSIMTDSMVGGNDKYEGGSYNVGDLVIGRVTNADVHAVYEVGDIVVFKTADPDRPLLAHRIVSIGTNENGVRTYTTKGDNAPAIDPTPLVASSIYAVCYTSDYHGAVIPALGGVISKLQTSTGFFFFILLPMIIFFIYEIIRVVLNVIDFKNSKAKEEREQSEEDRKAEIDAAVKAALEAAGKTSGDAAEAKDEAADEISAADGEAPAEKAAELTPEQMEQFKQFLAFQKAQEAKGDDSAEPQDGEPEE